MIHNRFLLFNSKADFDRTYNSEGIDPTSIAFIKNEHLIWTLNEFWKCADDKQELDLSEYLKKDELDLSKYVESGDLNFSSYLQKGDDLGYINGKLFKHGSNIVLPANDYTSEAGIEIDGTVIRLKKASENQIGGIKLGYVQNGNNYPVQINSESRAYVYVPSSNSGSNSGSSSNAVSGGYWEIIFKAFEIGQDVVLPINFDSNSEGWSHSAETASGNKIVYMTTRWIDGYGVKNPWLKPWRISGPNGENGVDGDEFEYIYTRTASENISAVPQLTNNKTQDDYVPANWFDSPQGINSNLKYEWMAFRKKVHSLSKPEGEWLDFIGPVLWSAYGRLGTDGDGVQYIYYAGYNYPSGDDRPDLWTNIPESGINQNSHWTDDPVNIEGNPGKKQWVSVRKKKNGSWGTYSKPALWSYCAKDGDAAMGVVADFDDDFIAVPVKEDGNCYSFRRDVTLSLYNGINNIPITNSRIKSVINSSNADITSLGIVSIEGPTLSIVFTEDLVNFQNAGTITVTAECTESINGLSITRATSLLIIGIRIGTDGSSYSLKPSSKVIRKHNNEVSPLLIKCSCIKIEGKNEAVEWSASGIETASRTYFGDGSYLIINYEIDDSGTTSLLISNVNTSSILDNVRFELVFVNGSTEIVLDLETIYVISDGIAGAAAVQYDIEVLYTDIRKEQTTYPGTNILNRVANELGTIHYKIARTSGSSREYIDNTNSDISTVAYRGGSSENNVTASYQSGVDPHWELEEINCVWDAYSNFTQIIVKEGNVVVKSVVVPTIIPGERGEAGTTTINQPLLRLRGEWVNNPSYSYKSGETAEDGITYVDVVTYGNSYYKCISESGAEAAAPDQNTTCWKLFIASSDIIAQDILANSAFVNSLSSHQVIVYNDDDPAKPCAGMLNGFYLPAELTNVDYQVGNTAGIRIFAGLVPSDGDISNTAFNVDELGNVSVGSGATKFYSDGSGSLAGGTIRWGSEFDGIELTQGKKFISKLVEGSYKVYAELGDSKLKIFHNAIDDSTQRYASRAQISDGGIEYVKRRLASDTTTSKMFKFEARFEQNEEPRFLVQVDNVDKIKVDGNGNLTLDHPTITGGYISSIEDANIDGDLVVGGEIISPSIKKQYNIVIEFVRSSQVNSEEQFSARYYTFNKAGDLKHEYYISGISKQNLRYLADHICAAHITDYRNASEVIVTVPFVYYELSQDVITLDWIATAKFNGYGGAYKFDSTELEELYEQPSYNSGLTVTETTIDCDTKTYAI